MSNSMLPLYDPELDVQEFNSKFNRMKFCDSIKI